MSIFSSAAFSRANLPGAQRRPFHVAVDEFHNFTSQSFADMLPECRKYALSLTLSNQHLLQLDPLVMEAVFGNVGSILAFRLGAMDAPAFCRQLGELEPENLIRLPNYHLWVQLMVEGRKTQAFSAQSLPAKISVQP